MAEEEKTHTYEETVSKTSDPEVHSETKVTTETITKSETAADTNRVDTVTSEEESVSAKAREAGRSLRDLVYSLGRKTKDVAEEKTQELKARSVDMRVTADARDIQSLGGKVEKLVTVFEDTMSEIRREPYAEQAKLLTGYKKLLEEQINVINARMELARRLKPGA